MRFRFCGDADCPDWILAQINTLARMSSIKMKLLSQAVAVSLVSKKPINYENAKKLSSDAKFDEEDVKATVSALSYILTSACKYGVTEATLSNELQQIGFPREHGQALCRVYSEHSEDLAMQLCRSVVGAARLLDVKTLPCNTHAEITLRFLDGATGQELTRTFSASKPQLALVVHDLKIACEKLEILKNEP